MQIIFIKILLKKLRDKYLFFPSDICHFFRVIGRAGLNGWHDNAGLTLKMQQMGKFGGEQLVQDALAILAALVCFLAQWKNLKGEREVRDRTTGSKCFAKFEI